MKPVKYRNTGYCNPHQERYLKTGRPVNIRFPIAPFREWVARVTRRDPDAEKWSDWNAYSHEGQEDRVNGGYVQDEIAADIGITLRTLHRWFQKGWLSIEQADLICTRLNLIHTELWPDFYDEPWIRDDELEDAVA